MTWDGPRLRFREQSPISVMLKQNRLDPTLGFFWGIVFVHVIFWTILSYKTQPNVPQRTLELLTAGRELAWGYEHQPPLSVWVTSVVGKIAAPRVWPLYMLAQLCGVVSVWAAWILARKFLHPWTALCGAIVLLGGYSCTIAASEFTSAHLASAFWSLSILSFHEALSESRRRYWAATGILLALGFLTSYGTLLLLITMFLFTIWNDHARRCWDSSWPFLAGLMMAAVMLPHLIWLVQHDFITVQTHLAPASSVVHHLEQPLAYLGTQLLCLIPVILLLTPLVAWFSIEEPASPQSEERNFARHYLLSMTCIPPVIIFTLALLAGPASSLFAGVTNWTFLGIALLLWGHLNETRLSWRRSLLRIGSAVGFFAAGLIAINLMLPHLSRQAFNTHFPGKELARGVERAWRDSGNTGPVPVIAGPEKLVRNAVWNSQNSSRVTMFENLTPASTQTALDTKLMEQGGVILWDNSDPSAAIGQQYVQRYGRVSLAAPQTLRWRGIADIPELNIGMAVVYPLLAQVTPRPTFPMVNAPITNTVPESALPLNYPRASTVPSYSNQTTLPANGNTTLGGNTTPTTPDSSLKGFTPPSSSVPATYQYPVTNPAAQPALAQPASSQPTYTQPAITPASGTPSTGTPALKGFDFPPSGISLGQPSTQPVPTSVRTQPITTPNSLPVSSPPTTRPAQYDPFEGMPAATLSPEPRPTETRQPTNPAPAQRGFDSTWDSLAPTPAPYSTPALQPTLKPAAKPVEEVLPEPLEMSPTPSPVGTGSSNQKPIPAYEFSKDFLNSLPGTNSGSPSLPASPGTVNSPVLPPDSQNNNSFNNNSFNNGTLKNDTPDSTFMNRMPDQFKAPIQTPAPSAAPAADPFAGGFLNEPTPASKGNSIAPSFPSSNSSIPSRNDLNDLLPASSGAPGGLKLPAGPAPDLSPVMPLELPAINAPNSPSLPKAPEGLSEN